MIDKTKELTDAQIERQDEVDNAIFCMIDEVLSGTRMQPEWDMEIIGEIRELIEEFYFGDLEEDKYNFYPWVERDEQVGESISDDGSIAP